MRWQDARMGANVGPGWVPLVDELHRRMTRLDPELVVEQVKEKFGGLRYYFLASEAFLDAQGRDGSKALVSIVSSAEVASFWICELCGKPGYEDTDGGYWIKTFCEEHHAERRAERQLTRP